MADILEDVENSVNTGRFSRPSLEQVTAVVEFIQKHPDLAYRRLRYNMSHEKFKKSWVELSNIANSIKGAIKSTKGWIKFWSDKRRCILVKHKKIKEGKLQDRLTPLEQKIYDLCISDKSNSRKKNAVKQERCNSDDEDSMDDSFSKSDDEKIGDSKTEVVKLQASRFVPTESDERQMSMMEKMIEVMDQQASALTQMAEASLSNSKSMEQIAEASHKQAVAVDRLATTFENINASIYDVRNAVISLDYTLKRCYSTTATHRQNNLFS